MVDETDKAEENDKELQIREALKAVVDPEIFHNIVDLGLVYKINYEEEKKFAQVNMTLTSPMCPYGPAIIEQVNAVTKGVEYVDDAEIKLVWSPPWDPKTMASDDIRMELGIW